MNGTVRILKLPAAFGIATAIAASAAFAQTQQQGRQQEYGDQKEQYEKHTYGEGQSTRQIDGQIKELRRVSFPGQDQTWLVAAIESPDGKSCTVVLGPEDRLREMSLQSGDQVNVQGQLAAPQGRGVFAAHQISSKGRSAMMGRQMQPQTKTRDIEGRINELRSVTLPGQDQSWIIVSIQSPEGQPTTVLLGPEDRLEQLNLQPGDQVNVKSALASAHGRGVFAAQQVSSKGQSVTMARGFPGQQEQTYGYHDEQQGRQFPESRAMTRNLEGKITEMRSVSLPGQDRSWVIAAIENQEGQTTTIVLGPKDRLEQLDLESGDQVSVQGMLVAPHGRGLFAAQRVMANGQSVTMARQMDPEGGRAFSRQIEGEITELKRVTLPGQERTWLVAGIETTDDQTRTVVLGPEDRLRQLELESGDHVNVQGLVAAAEGRGMFAAQRISSDGKSVTLARGFPSQPEQTFGYVDDQQGRYEREQFGGGRAMARHIEGRITELRRFTFPGQDRSWIVAALQTSDGQTMSVLLGPEDRLRQLGLDEGDQVTIDAFVAAGTGRIALAQRVSSDRGTITHGESYERGGASD